MCREYRAAIAGAEAGRLVVRCYRYPMIIDSVHASRSEGLWSLGNWEFMDDCFAYDRNVVRNWLFGEWLALQAFV